MNQSHGLSYDETLFFNYQKVSKVMMDSSYKFDTFVATLSGLRLPTFLLTSNNHTLNLSLFKNIYFCKKFVIHTENLNLGQFFALYGLRVLKTCL